MFRPAFYQKDADIFWEMIAVVRALPCKKNNKFKTEITSLVPLRLERLRTNSDANFSKLVHPKSKQL